MNDVSNLPVAHTAAAAVSAGFGTSEMAIGQESASSAVAAQARATVEARYVMALRRPRDWDQVRQSILRECRRPSFANNKSAFYRKPIGDGVEGLGIRFVEVALRCMTNTLVESNMIFEDALKEIHRVTVTDLESNTTYPLDVRVTKTVERSRPEDDGSFISVRKNSRGKAVYTVTATDDDMLNKRAAQISKAIRSLGLRIIPGDLQDEAEQIIKAVRLDEAAKDPDAARKAIADAFMEINVRAADLAAYLGHDIGSCSPHEIVALRGLYGAIKDGETSWSAAMENRELERAGGPSPAPTQESKSPASRTDAIKEKAKEAARKAQDAGQAGAAATEPEAPAMSFAEVADALEKAADRDAFDAACDLIQHVADLQQRDELGAIVKRRMPDFK